MDAKRRLDDAEKASPADNSLAINRLELSVLKEKLEKYQEIQRTGGRVYPESEGIVTRIQVSPGERIPDGASIVYADLESPLEYHTTLTKNRNCRLRSRKRSQPGSVRSHHLSPPGRRNLRPKRGIHYRNPDRNLQLLHPPGSPLHRSKRKKLRLYPKTKIRNPGPRAGRRACLRKRPGQKQQICRHRRRHHRQRNRSNRKHHRTPGGSNHSPLQRIRANINRPPGRDREEAG